MTGFWFLCTLLVIESTAILAESLEKSELISFTRTKRQMRTNNNMCSGQKLLLLSPEGAILESGERGNNISFHVGEKAKFVCKDGYWQVGELQSFICQEDGKWKEYSKNRTGLCVVKDCNREIFSCKYGKTKIDACRQCDCVADCPDLSDESSCAPVLVDVTGKATGTLTSALKNNRKTTAAHLTCSSWKLQTNDQEFYIKLLFKKFSMSANCNNNFVSLESANFTDTLRTAKCCEPSSASSSFGVCKFGGTTPPPLSRTATNWMTVMFFSSNNESTFTAVWYNVNNLYPDGLIPVEDPTFASRIKLPMRKKYTPQSAGTTPVLALVLFALLLFVLGCFISCKIGRRYLGLTCSFRHFVAWVLCRRSLHESLSSSSEHGDLTLDMLAYRDEESARRTPGRLQATYLGDDSDDSRDGSTDNMICDVHI